MSRHSHKEFKAALKYLWQMDILGPIGSLEVGVTSDVSEYLLRWGTMSRDLISHSTSLEDIDIK